MEERVEVWKAKDGYRWRRVVEDVQREIVSESGEAYVRKIDAVRQARRLNAGVDIYDLESTAASRETAADE